MIWSDLHPELLRGAPNAPTFLLDESLRAAARELCERTDVYKLEETVTLPVGLDEVEPWAPEHFELCHILSMRHPHTGARGMEAKSFEDMRYIQAEMPGGGTPRAYAGIDNVRVYVAPKPATEIPIDVVYSVKPQRTAEGLPDTLGLEYVDALSYGALTRLLSQPDTPWRDDGMARVYGNKFRREVTKIARIVRFGFGGASLTAHPRAFF